MDSGEEQESYANSGFECEELNRCLEKIAVDCEYQEVIPVAQMEPGVWSGEEDDGGEERQYSEPIDDENDKRIDARLDNSFLLMEDSVVDASKEDENEEIQPTHVGEDQGQVVEEKEKGVDETILENDGDFIDDRIDNGITMARGEGISAACVDFGKMKDVSKMADHDVTAAFGAEETHVNEDPQTFFSGDHCESAFAGIKNLNEGLLVTVNEDNSPRPLIIQEEKDEEPAQKAKEDVQALEAAKVDDQKAEREEKEEEKAQKVEEQASTDGQAIEEAKADAQKVEREEKGEETTHKVEEQASIDDTAIEEAKVDDQKVKREEKGKETEQKVEERMGTDDQGIEEAKVDARKAEGEGKGEEQVSTDGQAIEEEKVDNQKVEREEIGVETAQKVEEQGSTNDQATEDAKVDQKVDKENGEEIAVELQVETSTEDEFIKNEEESKEDEIPLVQLIKEDEEAEGNKEDTTVDRTRDLIWPDKSTPEANISNLKVEENTKEKEQNGTNNQNGIIEDKGSSSASRYSETEPWNLKLRTWSILVSIWCLCHWYSELPFLELSLVSSILFILILLRYQNHTTNLIKHE